MSQNMPLMNSNISERDLESQLSPKATPGRSQLLEGPPKYKTYIGRLDALKQRRELAEELFWYQVLGPSIGTNFEFFQSNKYRYTQFGGCREEFRETLKGPFRLPHTTNTSLQLCIINTTPVPNEIYSWWTQLFSAKLHYLTGLAEFPRYAIAYEIEQAWGGLSDCAYKAIKFPEQTLRIEQLSLPEFREQFLSHDEPDCKCKTYRIPNISNHYDLLPLKTPEESKSKAALARYSRFKSTFSVSLPSDSTNGEKTTAASAQIRQCANIFERRAASFTFTWQRAAQTYAGGLDTFLWERHSKPPSCDYAEVFYQDDRDSSQPRRVLMTVSSTPKSLKDRTLMREIKSLMHEDPERKTSMWPFLQQLRMQQTANNNGYTLIPLFVVFEQIIRDTAFFMQEASDQMRKISFAGRSAASVEKIQFLCHLGDCRSSSLYGVEHAKSVAEGLLGVLRHDIQGSPKSSLEIEFLEVKLDDLDYLHERLAELERQIKIEIEQIDRHRGLAQSRMIAILTWIATIYVPLSFVTGMLGMQITDPANFFSRHERKSSLSNPSSSTSAVATSTGSATSSTSLAARQAEQSVSALPSPTDAVLQYLSSNLAQETSIANSTPYIWSFSFFLVLSVVFFICSLMLPLVGPNLLRIVVQRSYRIRNWFIFWPFIFVSYYIFVYWVIPEAMYGYLRCPDHSDGVQCTRGQNGYYYISNFISAGYNPINTVSYVVSAVVMGAIGLGNIARAIMFRRGAVVYVTWLLYAAVVVVVYWVDFYKNVENNYPYPIGTGLSLSAIIPLAYVVVVWLAPQVWEAWQARRAEKENKVRKKVQ